MKNKTQRNKLYTLATLLCFFAFSLIVAFFPPQSLHTFASSDTLDLCTSQYCPNHGTDRGNGYFYNDDQDNYLTSGCRNWKGSSQTVNNEPYTYSTAHPDTNLDLQTFIEDYGIWSYSNDGQTNEIVYDPDVLNIPYWINTSGFNAVAPNKVSEIMNQAMMWNSTRVYDDLGVAKQIVNLVRVQHKNVSQNPYDPYKEPHICEIRYEDISQDLGGFGIKYLQEEGGTGVPTGDNAYGVGGLFDANNLIIKLHAKLSPSGNTPLYGPTTPLHEMGHLLGLGDLDDLPLNPDYNIPIGTHSNVLMGYKRPSGMPMMYPDIQGVLYQNSVTHDCTDHLKRYVEYEDGSGSSGGQSSVTRYLHFCFYCDMMFSEPSPLQGAQEMEAASGCLHEWLPLVSAAPSRLWHKCARCCRVTSEALHTVTFDLNGGSGALPAPVRVADGDTTPLPPDAELSCFTLTNHTPVGWHTRGGSYPDYTYTPFEFGGAGGGTAVRGDTELYLVWELNRYSVSFNLDGGEGEGDYSAQVVTHGQTAARPELDPKRPYSLFEYWTDTADAQLQPYDFNAAVEDDTELFAVYDGYGAWGGGAEDFTIGNVGDGSESAPWELYYGEQLAWLAQEVGSGNSYAGEYFVLTDNIYLNDVYRWDEWDEFTADLNLWAPIGTESSPFCGVFDGGGFAVRGVYAIESVCYDSRYYDNDYYDFYYDLGLFGYIEYAVVRNLGVEQSFIGGGFCDNAGGIVGSMYGSTVINCYNTGTVQGYWNVGGIAGVASKAVGEDEYQQQIITPSIIAGCYNAGYIGGFRGTGGIAGFIAGMSTGGGLYYAGNVLIDGCFNTGAVESYFCAGGIAGRIQGGSKIANSFNAGVVLGEVDTGGIAGFVESNYNEISNNYNTGALYALSGFVGGIVGRLDPYGPAGSYGNTVFNNYNAGALVGGPKGGIVGGLFSGDQIKNNCYLANANAVGNGGGSSWPNNYSFNQYAVLNGGPAATLVGALNYGVENLYAGMPSAWRPMAFASVGLLAWTGEPDPPLLVLPVHDTGAFSGGMAPAGGCPGGYSGAYDYSGVYGNSGYSGAGGNFGTDGGYSGGANNSRPVMRLFSRVWLFAAGQADDFEAYLELFLIRLEQCLELQPEDVAEQMEISILCLSELLSQVKLYRLSKSVVA